MSEIRNCALRFSCSKQWDELQPLSNPKIRYCRECGDKVYFCESDEEIVLNIRSNNCIAFQDTWLHATLGVPVFFPPVEFALSDKKVIENLQKSNIKDFEKLIQFTRKDIKLLAGLTELEMREIDEFMSSRGLEYPDEDF